MEEITIPDGMDTKKMITGSGALGEVAGIFKEFFPEAGAWLVADGNTWAAAGEKLNGMIKAAGIKVFEPYIFPVSPVLHPDKACSDVLAGKISTGAIPVAVGSGVINDLVKCAAGIADVPYCCVATAASVDGYTSSGAALSVDGMKVTVKCSAPAVIVADTDVLGCAPPEMVSWGYGDLFSKVTAGADWHIADTLGIEPIDPRVWDMVQKNLSLWLSDSENHERIFQGLAATGFAMQAYKDSRPASGAEHLISHIWEMEGLKLNGSDISHGYKVGIGTLAVTLLMTFVLDIDADKARRLSAPGLTRHDREREVDRLLERGCYGTGVKSVAMEKFLDGEALAERREIIFEKWGELQQRISEQLVPYAKVREHLENAGCPVSPSGIGLGTEQFIHGVVTAQLIRKRYTILDLLYESGLMDSALKKLDLLPWL